MANHLFTEHQANANPIMKQFGQFRQNPMQFLLQKNINIPQEYMNDPHGAVQYLMNSGRMSQDQFNRLSQMAQQMGVKF